MARSKRGFYFVKTRNGSPPAGDEYNLASGTYYEGSVLRMSATTGSCILFGSEICTGLFGVASAYVATADAYTTKMYVYHADGNNVFRAKMLNSQIPNAKLNDKVDVHINSTSNFSIKGTAGTSAAVRIVGYSKLKDDNATAVTGAAAATGVQYYVTFVNAKTVFGDASNKP